MKKILLIMLFALSSCCCLNVGKYEENKTVNNFDVDSTYIELIQYQITSQDNTWYPSLVDADVAFEMQTDLDSAQFLHMLMKQCDSIYYEIKKDTNLIGGKTE
jgi:hypothetical protein